MNNDAGRRKITRRSFLRKGTWAATMCAAVPVVAGCTWLDARDDERYAVEMSTQSRFDPAGITVPVGATVVWRNMDEDPHTATADAGLLDDPNRVRVPDGAETWDSGEVLTGEQWEHTFTVPGTYVYACQYHQADGMVGTITVEPAES